MNADWKKDKERASSGNVQVKAGALVALAEQLRGLAATIDGLLATEDAPEPYAITLRETMERLGCTRKDVAKLIQHCILDNSPGTSRGL